MSYEVVFQSRQPIFDDPHFRFNHKGTLKQATYVIVRMHHRVFRKRPNMLVMALLLSEDKTSIGDSASRLMPRQSHSLVPKKKKYWANCEPIIIHDRHVMVLILEYLQPYSI